MPLISVIIPCFNLGQFLGDALDSILVQTFNDFEVIIVNDGSDDPATVRMLQTLNRPKTRVVHMVNGGVASARNRGIGEAAGRYILPLDADDRIAPTYLEQAIAVLDAQSEVGIVYCRAELFGEASGEWLLPKFSLPHQLLDNLIFSAAIFRRKQWELVGGYSERMRTGWEDWDFWLRLTALGVKVVQLDEPLFFYRIRRGSRDRSIGFFDKFLLMARLLADNRWLYLQNSLQIARILINGERRCPALRQETNERK
jgi:glycosyltransferase involved in cell wall biosynthesis